jgi:hypothetical protein
MLNSDNNGLVGQYWINLKELGLPNYLYLGDELVIVTHLEKRKRKKGAAVNQVYFHLEDGRVKHATYFRKVDIKLVKREFTLNKILND